MDLLRRPIASTPNGHQRLNHAWVNVRGLIALAEDLNLIKASANCDRAELVTQTKSTLRTGLMDGLGVCAVAIYDFPHIR